MATSLLTNLQLAAAKALTGGITTPSKLPVNGGTTTPSAMPIGSGTAAPSLTQYSATAPQTTPQTTTAPPATMAPQTVTTSVGAQKVQTGSYQWGNDTVPIYAYLNPATGQPIQSNPAGPAQVAPTNALISADKHGAGMNYSTSDIVVSPGYATDGLRIGDFYTNPQGVEYQIIGIGSDGNPLTGVGRNNGGANQDGYSGYLTAANRQAGGGAGAVGGAGNASANALGGYAQNAYQAAQYNNRYDAIINQQAGQVINRDPFSYDHNTDPEYQAFLKAYLREGDIASNNALAQAAARTGGLPSSYAMAVANQARDYYAAKAADRIPELSAQAFNRYVTEDGMNRQDVAMMQGLENSDWSKYTNTRDFNYGVENTAYNRQIADRDYQLALQQMMLGNERYDDETQYARGMDAYNQAMQRATLLGYVSASDAAILGIPAGTAFGTTAKSGGSGGSGSGSSGSGASDEYMYYNPGGAGVNDVGSGVETWMNVIKKIGLPPTLYTPEAVAEQSDSVRNSFESTLRRAVASGTITQAEYELMLKIDGEMTS